MQPGISSLLNVTSHLVSPVGTRHNSSFKFGQNPSGNYFATIIVDKVLAARRSQCIASVNIVIKMIIMIVKLFSQFSRSPF